MSEDERILIDWVREQEMFTMPLDDVSDEYKVKIAETLVAMYGEKVLKEYYDERKMSKFMRLEKMLEEILYDSHATVKGFLKEDDMFGE